MLKKDPLKKTFTLTLYSLNIELYIWIGTNSIFILIQLIPAHSNMYALRQNQNKEHQGPAKCVMNRIKISQTDVKCGMRNSCFPIRNNIEIIMCRKQFLLFFSVPHSLSPLKCLDVKEENSKIIRHGIPNCKSNQCFYTLIYTQSKNNTYKLRKLTARNIVLQAFIRALSQKKTHH